MFLSFAGFLLWNEGKIISMILTVKDDLLAWVEEGYKLT